MGREGEDGREMGVWWWKGRRRERAADRDGA